MAVAFISLADPTVLAHEIEEIGAPTERQDSEPKGHPRPVEQGMSPRFAWPPENAVGEVSEKLIKDYPEDE